LGTSKIVKTFFSFFLAALTTDGAVEAMTEMMELLALLQRLRGSSSSGKSSQA